MSRKLKFLSIIIVLITMLIIAIVLSNSISSATAVRIMPLGDSITAGGTWRPLLLTQLLDSGYDVELVGTQQDNYTYHEGYSGMSAVQLGNSGNLDTWLSATNPDIVIMHLGTNDCWGENRYTDEIIDAYTKFVHIMRANNSNMVIMVAKLIPMYPSGVGEMSNNHILDLNSRINGWAGSLTTGQSPIIVVDHYTGFNANNDTYDGVHPNDSGCVKMANKWFGALDNYLSSSTIPTTTSSTSIGDVNLDSNINIVDALIVAQYYVGSTPNNFHIENADVNSDGRINITDALLIAQYAVGGITSF